MAVKFRDYYEVLGVSKTATEDEIKKTYRKWRASFTLTSLTLDALASRAGMHPALVERFVEFGLIEPVQQEGARPLFDPSAVPRLRVIGRLPASFGINLAGVAVILDLLDRLSALQRENETPRTGRDR